MFDCAGDTEEPLGYQVKGTPMPEFIQPFSLQFIWNCNSAYLENILFLWCKIQ